MTHVKDSFPFFAANPGTTWLDSAATTQKPQVVIDTVTRFMAEFNSNTGRGNSYRESRRATEMIEGARATVARFIGAEEPECLVWTTGTTEAINMVAGAFVVPEINQQDRCGTIVFSDDNHHAGIVPWHILKEGVFENDPGVETRVMGFCENCFLHHPLEVDDFLDGLQDVVLLVIPHISNVLGMVNDIAKIVEAAHRHGVPVLVDGAQVVGHMPVNVQELDVDFYAFSGHKMLGPTGIGGLYVAPHMFDRMGPWKGGGEMITRVTTRSFETKPMPHLLEPGTQNVAGAVGLAAAVRYLEELGMARVEAHIKSLGQYAQHHIGELKGVTILGQNVHNGGSGSLVAFTFMPKKGIHHESFVAALSEAGIAIRAGRFCADPLMDRLNLEDGAMRMSFHIYNDKDDVDKAVAVLEAVLANELPKAAEQRRLETGVARGRQRSKGCC
ncbi:MAG: cysteine desulfurase [Patescibacteria group bacterium]|jgi:SufS family cysteine desulfurase